jgi:hypothetical protein
MGPVSTRCASVGSVVIALVLCGCSGGGVFDSGEGSSESTRPSRGTTEEVPDLPDVDDATRGATVAYFEATGKPLLVTHDTASRIVAGDHAESCDATAAGLESTAPLSTYFVLLDGVPDPTLADAMSSEQRWLSAAVAGCGADVPQASDDLARASALVDARLTELGVPR